MWVTAYAIGATVALSLASAFIESRALLLVTSFLGIVGLVVYLCLRQ